MNQQFKFVFDQYASRLIIHAQRFVGSRADAEDIVADVYCNLWQRRDEIDFECGIYTYLYKAVASRALNFLRHKNIAELQLETLQTLSQYRLDFMADSNVEHELENAELRQQLQQSIDDLPEKCREVFILSYIHGLKNAEIAQAMNVSVRTVDAHMYKALKALRKSLRPLSILINLITIFTFA